MACPTRRRRRFPTTREAPVRPPGLSPYLGRDRCSASPSAATRPAPRVPTDNPIRAGVAVQVWQGSAILELLKFLADVTRSLFRSRAACEAEVLFLRQQLIVVQRASTKRIRVWAIDKLIFLLLYRCVPRSGAAHHLPTGDADPVAPSEISGLLAMEISQRSWPPADSAELPGVGMPHPAREPDVGRAAYPRRTA